MWVYKLSYSKIDANSILIDSETLGYIVRWCKHYFRYANNLFPPYLLVTMTSEHGICICGKVTQKFIVGHSSSTIFTIWFCVSCGYYICPESFIPLANIDMVPDNLADSPAIVYDYHSKEPISRS